MPDFKPYPCLFPTRILHLLLVKMMGLSWMQQAHLVALLLQFVIEILMVARGRLHPNDDLVGDGIQLRQFLFQHLPSSLDIGKGDRPDHHTFVGPTNAARTGLASNVNPTHVPGRGFLLRGGSRWSHIHHTPAFVDSLHPWIFHLVLSVTEMNEREARPSRVSVSSYRIGNLAHVTAFREATGCCNKPYRPFVPWWTGSRLEKEVTIHLTLNRPQANTQALPLLPPIYPISGYTSILLL